MRRAVAALSLAATLGLATAALAGCTAQRGPELVLKTAHTGAGDVVVDATGRAVYLYAKDSPGARTGNCDGSCLAEWPAVTTSSTTPQGEGISGRIGEIPAAGGGYQVTLEGWPLYYFDGDTGPGMIKGQGIGSVWWLLDPSGTRVTAIGR
jgi:predicted lipoprotein with Yx(FWY)xxD motif